MLLILFGLVAVFLPSISCSTCLNGNFTRTIVVEIGESRQLECYAGGETNVTIEWHREPFPHSKYQNISLPNGEKTYKGNVLELSSITRHQSGIYICSVDNQCGTFFRHFRVKVYFKPIILEIYRIHRLASQELELRCNVESEPSAIVTWIRHFDGEEYPTRCRGFPVREFYDTLNSTLIISDYDFYDDVFTYECKFENLMGTGAAIFKATKMRSTPKKLLLKSPSSSSSDWI